VVIPTKNRAEPLRRCLRSLATQSAQDFGIIIVDDHSDEPIEAMVAELAAEVSFDVDPVVIRLPESSGPAAARNVGVDASDAEFVIFIDDDVVADRHLIEVHLSEVIPGRGSERPIVTRGPFVEPAEWDPTPWNLWEAQMATRGTNALVRGDYVMTWRQFHTGNNCMPVELFKRLGGFDEGFRRAEDDELGMRLEEAGCEFRFVPAALAYHYADRSLEAWLAIPRGYGHYAVVMDRRFPQEGFLADRKAELARSHPLMRAVRTAARGPRRTKAAVSLAVNLGQLAYRARLTKVAMAGFSLAYDLSYSEAIREAEDNETAASPAPS
jgi:glycosyltransferase involved in cell wall biosynthesis